MKERQSEGIYILEANRESYDFFYPDRPFLQVLKPSSSTQQPLNLPVLALSHCLIKLYMFR